MQAIGERLREARMRLGLDIAEVELATKIRTKYLSALENEEFELLPGPTFVKTFMRTYAEYLGLDAQLLVEEYRAQYEPRELDVQPFVPASSRRERPRRAPRGPTGPPGPGTALLVVVVVLIVIFAILGLTGGGNKGSSSQQAAQPATTARRPAPAAPARPKPRPRPTVVVLRVLPASPTYVCIDHGAGTTPAFQGIVGSPRTFTARHVRINAGIASIGLVVNHRRVHVPQTSQPIGYDFTPTRTTTLPPLQRPCIR